MFPGALSPRVLHKPGVQRWPGQINEFHGRHYRLTPTGAASPVRGIGRKFLVFMDFAESAGIGGFSPSSRGGVRTALRGARPGLGSAHLSCRATWMRLDRAPPWRQRRWPQPVNEAQDLSEQRSWDSRTFYVRYGSQADVKRHPSRCLLSGVKRT